jgi:DNA-binding NtrC family response regulator
MSVNLSFATASTNAVSNAPAPMAAPEKRIEQHPSAAASVMFTVGQSLADIEHEMIIKTMQATRGNRTRAAKMLGISVRTLYTKLLKIESEAAPAMAPAPAPVEAHQRSA